MRLKEVDYKGKRLAPKILGITVWLNGENIEVNGTLDQNIMTASSEGHQPL
jgi:hypothetical protein